MLNKLIGFIDDFGYGDISTMNDQTRIQEDLNITGTDAVEFIISFGKKFNVDISNFMAADYFEAEGYPLFMTKLAGKTPKKVLTIGHLEKAIKAGKLDEEVINN